MEFARLDATAFPHIFELVLAHAPDELLLRVRLVNRASQTFVDRLLFEHVAFTHKGGPVYTPGLTLPDPPPVVYAYSLSSRSFSSRRLPLPALVVGTGGKLIVPPHPGWAHTRVLDLETAMRTFGSHIEEPVEFPVLHTVRRRAWIFEQKSAHTLVDVLRVPLPWKHDKAIHPLAPGVERHVLLVLYDPTWDGVTSRIGFHSPWSPWDLSSHAVIIFRPCPRDERVTHSHLIKEPTGRTGTFLHFFFCLVTNRYRGSYTFVGLENVPTHILAKELDLSSDDLLLAAAHQSTGDNEHWARVVAVRTIEAIRAIPSDDQEFLEVDDIVEVLTMDEYRAREGEDVWVRETFGNRVGVCMCVVSCGFEHEDPGKIECRLEWLTMDQLHERVGEEAYSQSPVAVLNVTLSNPTHRGYRISFPDGCLLTTSGSISDTISTVPDRPN